MVRDTQPTVDEARRTVATFLKNLVFCEETDWLLEQKKKVIEASLFHVWPAITQFGVSQLDLGDGLICNNPQAGPDARTIWQRENLIHFAKGSLPVHEVDSDEAFR